MSEAQIFHVVGPNNARLGAFVTFPDARKAAEEMLADGRAAQAHIEWTTGGQVQQQTVLTRAEEVEAITQELLGTRAPRLFDYGRFRPAMVGAIVVAAIGLLAWALYSALDIVLHTL